MRVLHGDQDHRMEQRAVVRPQPLTTAATTAAGGA